MKFQDVIKLTFLLFRGSMLKKGINMCGEPASPEEEKIGAAFLRVWYGTWILSAVCTAALIIITLLNNPFLATGSKRYGTVRSDGTISYAVEDTIHSATQEDLGLDGYGLKSGDKVVLFFKTRKNEFKKAFPTELFEQCTKMRLRVIFYSAMLLCTAMFVFGFVICRLTPFGRDWYLYCKRLRLKKELAVSRRGRTISCIAAAAAAVVLIAAQGVNLYSHVAALNEIQQPIMLAASAESTAN